MEITQARHGDALTIMDLFKECIGDMAANGLFQWDDTYPNINIVTKDMESGTLFNSIDKGKCTGVITLNEEQPVEYGGLDWTPNTSRALVVHRLAVHPDWQKQGLGNKLMDYAEKFAVQNGYAAIRLDTYSINKKAVSFYEHRGYKKVGEVYFPHRQLPFFCYEKLVNKL